ENDHGQCHRGDGDPGIAPDAHGHNGGQGGGKDIDDIVADQDGTQQSVGPTQHALGPAGGLIALLAQVFEPVAVEAHHPGFGTGNEGRADNQQRQDQQYQAGTSLAQELPRYGSDRAPLTWAG